MDDTELAAVAAHSVLRQVSLDRPARVVLLCAGSASVEAEALSVCVGRGVDLAGVYLVDHAYDDTVLRDSVIAAVRARVPRGCEVWTGDIVDATALLEAVGARAEAGRTWDNAACVAIHFQVAARGDLLGSPAERRAVAAASRAVGRTPTSASEMGDSLDFLREVTACEWGGFFWQWLLRQAGRAIHFVWRHSTQPHVVGPPLSRGLSLMTLQEMYSAVTKAGVGDPSLLEAAARRV